MTSISSNNAIAAIGKNKDKNYKIREFIKYLD